MWTITCQYRQALYSVPSIVLCPPGQRVEIKAGQQTGAHLPPGQADQDSTSVSLAVAVPPIPDDYPAELSAYTMRAPDAHQAQARPYTDRRWPNSPNGSSTTGIPWSKITPGAQADPAG